MTDVVWDVLLDRRNVLEPQRTGFKALGLSGGNPKLYEDKAFNEVAGQLLADASQLQQTARQTPVDSDVLINGVGIPHVALTFYDGARKRYLASMEPKQAP
ncbi:Uncharacterised protein [uncultured archaeon]|nr:Uncharacterised protein [uncultured archaeon]